MIRVLFVCTGNICRSPMAEGVLRARIGDADLAEHVDTDSAGTHGYHVGDSPDHRAHAVAATRGFDLSGQRARRVHPSDFAEYDFVIALDRGHVGHLESMCPAPHRERIHLLMSFADDAGGHDVPDPYYGDAEDFHTALDMIERGVDGLLAAIRETHLKR